MGENGNEVRNTLSIRDNRTGKNYEVDILEGDVIRAMDLRQIRVDDADFGMMAYDPAFTNTASTRSTVTYIDGGKGILRYRGYPIDQLAERSTHLEVSYLLLHGELPTQAQLDGFVHEVTFHTYVHENITDLFEGFRYDAHAMGMVISGVSALSTFYPEAKDVDDPASRWQQIVRLVAKMPTLAAYAYRHHRGLPYVYPENELSYTANFLNMLFRIGARDYKPSHRFVAGRSVLGHGRSDGGPLRSAARGRQRGSAAHAQSHRARRQHPVVHGGSEEEGRAPHGFRASRLQGLRSARQHHQAHRG
jgi:citrate synthase